MPDLYQGHELIDLSLVDPDNRRTPDYALCSRLLDEFDAAPDGGADYAKTLVADPSDGRAKLLGVAGRAPLGDAAWGDTRIDVPGTADGATFVNVLTGERMTLCEGSIPLARACVLSRGGVAYGSGGRSGLGSEPPRA